MTALVADVTKDELNDELQPGVQFLQSVAYAGRLKMLTGGHDVTLNPDVIGGYVKDHTFVPVRKSDTMFDVKYNLRTYFSKQ